MEVDQDHRSFLFSAELQRGPATYSRPSTMRPRGHACPSVCILSSAGVEPYLRRGRARRLVELKVVRSEQPVQPAASHDRARRKDPRRARVRRQRFMPTRDVWTVGVEAVRNRGTRQSLLGPERDRAPGGLCERNRRRSPRRVRAKLPFAFTAALTRAWRRYSGAEASARRAEPTYYVAPVYFKWNVSSLFEARRRSRRRSVRYEVLFEAHRCSWRFAKVFRTTLHQRRSASSDNDGVDFVFTDPPFGSNIFYSDIEHVSRSVARRVTEDAQEAVVDASGHGEAFGAQIRGRLRGAFLEAFQCSSRGGSSQSCSATATEEVWALLTALPQDSGFSKPCSVPSSTRAAFSEGTELRVGVSSPLIWCCRYRKSPTGQQSTIVCPSKTNGRCPAPPWRIPSCAASGWTRIRGGTPATSTRLSSVERSSRSVLWTGQLHYSDVLVALRQAGASLDPKKGLLAVPIDPKAMRRHR